MTDCPQQNTLLEFLNEELSEDSLAGMAQHLNECADCCRQVDQLSEQLDFSDPISAVTSPDEDPAIELQQTSEQARRIADLIGRLQSPDYLFLDDASSLSTRPDASSRVRFPGEPTDDAPLGTLGRYNIIQSVGSGATGHVFRAWDSQLHRIVAIKVLRQELATLESARQRFAREANAAAQVTGENIVSILEVGSDNDFPPWLVLEFVDGGSLKDSIPRRESMDPVTVARQLCELLSGLSAAHAQGVIHRDVKPGNILIDDRSGSLRLADFGMARLAEVQTADLTADGVIAGTPAYMSPEQVSSPSDVDERSDVYSAGVVMYELLTGEQPFRGTVRMLLHRVLHDDPIPPRKRDHRIPHDLQNICVMSMAKDPSRRYQTASEFREDLLCFLTDKPVLARPITLAERASRWCLRNPVVAGMSFAIVLLILSGVYGWASFTTSLTTNNQQLTDAVDALNRTNDELDIAIRRAEAGERTATQNATVAEDQLNVAFDMVRTLVFEVQNELADQPGTEQLRQRLLTRALDGLDRVSESAVSTLATQSSRVMAENRLADVLQELGQLEAAQQHFERALATSLQMLEDKTNIVSALQAHVLTCWNLAVLHAQRGDSTQAFVTYEAGMTSCRRWLEASADDADCQVNMLLGSERIAQLQVDNGDADDALSTLTECISRATVFLADHPHAPDIVRSLATVQLKLGRVLGSLDDAASVTALRRSRQLFSQLELTDDVDGRSTQLSYVTCGLLLAQQLGASNPAEAEELCRDTLRQCRSATSGDDAMGRLQSMALLRLGQILVAQKRYTEALPNLDASRERFAIAARDATAIPADRIALVDCLLGLATAELALDHSTRSTQFLDQAERQLADRPELDPTAGAVQQRHEMQRKHIERLKSMFFDKNNTDARP
ncbi:MAG TPA: serine/threonine protein kinase [Fuerstia sp.]|nr:serine/threonine protein kinase [Fuerstiella sp.]